MKKRLAGSMTAALVAFVAVIPLTAQPQAPAQRQNAVSGRGTNLGLYRNQPVPPTGPVVKLRDGAVDLSGVWLGGGSSDADISRALKPGDKLIMLPWAEQLVKTRQSKEDPEANCLPAGVPRGSPYPWRIVQTPTHYFILFEGNIHSYRQIFMNAKHPDDPDPTWYGHSVGQWDGGTLVVDTVGFNVQEFVAETRERDAFMSTKKARRYQRGSISQSVNGEIWYGKYYPEPGAPQKRVQLGRCCEMNEKQARTALDDIVAALNKNPSQALGGELVRRFVNQVYVPQKNNNGDWRDKTGQEAERMYRRSILPEIGDLHCRDLRPENLRSVLCKMASAGLSRGTVSHVTFALKDMVKIMVAEGYLTTNIAEGLKTPRNARRTDRSRLRRVTLAEYLQAWDVLDERERLACDLVLFCGLRESEAYALKNGDLFEYGAIRIQRSWYRGEDNPTKTNEIRNAGLDSEIFDRLTAWISQLPDTTQSAWVFPSERMVTALLPDNVLRRCIYPRLAPLGLDWINFAVLRRSHSTLHKEKGTDPKIIADQQGHGLGVHLSEYVDSSLASKRTAVSALWADFKVLKSATVISNRDK